MLFIEIIWPGCPPEADQRWGNKIFHPSHP
jgi:hypothetical protein